MKDLINKLSTKIALVYENVRDQTDVISMLIDVTEKQEERIKALEAQRGRGTEKILD